MHHYAAAAPRCQSVRWLWAVSSERLAWEACMTGGRASAAADRRLAPVLCVAGHGGHEMGWAWVVRADEW
jgi:hypothetical protein